VVLQVLGVDDYGIYSVVGGVVGMLSFLNGALSNGTSRFLTYELGKKDLKRTIITFQNSFIIHLLLAVIVFAFLETFGLWFVKNRLVISADRISAAIMAYHFSVISSCVSIVQVPYTSLIIAHEKMGIYAYLTIVDVIVKLVVVFALQLVGSVDKLSLYAFLLAVTQIMIALIYVGYCKKTFVESTLTHISFNKQLSKKILGFSSWSLIGNLSGVLSNQGMTIITNIFFSPVIVAARAISITVNNIVVGFVQNFRTAANPQIIKLYASGNVEESQKLMLTTTQYSYYLMLVIAVPVICIADVLLSLWLVEVPIYTTIFVQLIMVQSMFYTLDTCFYTGLYACGEVRQNALISPMFYILQFGIVYVLFRLGFSPITMSIVGILTTMLVSLIVKPILLNKLAGYCYSDIYRMIGKCLLTSILPLVVSAILFSQKSGNILLQMVMALLSLVITVGSIMYIGFNQQERNTLIRIILGRLTHIKNI
jgi:O-antigen/teichoic acid export membrane protein